LLAFYYLCPVRLEAINEIDSIPNDAAGILIITLKAIVYWAQRVELNLTPILCETSHRLEVKGVSVVFVRLFMNQDAGTCTFKQHPAYLSLTCIYSFVIFGRRA
jgi:hypothetical protein